MRSPSTGSICIVAIHLNYIVRNGGVGTSNWLLAHLLARRGWKVHVLYSGDIQVPSAIPQVRRRLAKAGIDFTMVDDLPVPPEIMARGWPTIEWLQRSHRVHHALEQLHRATPFDLIEFSDGQCAGFRVMQARRTSRAFGNAGTLVKLHGPSQWCREGDHKWLLGPDDLLIDHCERDAFDHADFQISPSQYMLDFARNIGWTVRDDSTVVPNVLGEAEYLTPDRPFEQPPELVFFGRLETRKGVEIFVEAARDLDPRIPITFIGGDMSLADGSLASSYILSRLGGRPVRLMTDLNREQALSYLSQGNRVAVIPSLAETFCYTLTECLSNGIPFLASRVGPIPEFIACPKMRERLLFDTDSKSLTRCLTSYLQESPEQRRAWRNALLASHDVRQHNDAVVGLYSRILQQVRARGDITRVSARSKDMPKVTIAVAVNGSPHQLQDTLASLAAQTYPNLEVLLVADNAAKKETLCTPVQQGNACVRYLNGGDGSLSALRDLALAEAEGEFVLPLEAGDVITSDMVVSLVETLRVNPDSAAVSCYSLYLGPDENAPSEQSFVFRPTGGPYVLGSLHNVFGESASLFRVAALRSVGGFRDHSKGHGDGWRLYVKLVTAGHRVEVCPRHLLVRPHRPVSPQQVIDEFLNQRQILEMYAQSEQLTTTEAIALWTALRSFALQRQGSLDCLRYRVADWLNRAAKRIPGVHSLVKALVYKGSFCLTALRRFTKGQAA